MSTTNVQLCDVIESNFAAMETNFRRQIDLNPLVAERLAPTLQVMLQAFRSMMADLRYTVDSFDELERVAREVQEKSFTG